TSKPTNRGVMAKLSPERIPATIFFRDTQVPLMDVETWSDEDGSFFFQRTEFPFLIASAETEQDAVNQLVGDAELFFHEVADLIDADDTTDEEAFAAAEIGKRLVDGYRELERRSKRKRALSIFVGRTRREIRGNFVRSRETPERPPQASPPRWAPLL